jgi:ABC-2 type transport system permease protein
MSTLVWAVSDSAAMIRRSVLLSIRSIDALLMSVMLPVLLMLMFVYVFGGAISTQAAPGAQSPAYVDYVVPGIMLLCAGYGSSMSAVSVNSDMRNGVIDRFQSMPIVSAAVLTGHVTAALLRNTVSMLLVVGTAALLGFRPEAGVLDWAVAVGLIWLFMLAIGWLSAAIGLLTSSAEAAGGSTFFMLFVPYLSSAFVPTQTMPSALQWVSENQPVTPVIETLRGLLMGTPVGDSGWLAVLWCGGLAVVGYVWATWLFRRRSR